MGLPQTPQQNGVPHWFINEHLIRLSDEGPKAKGLCALIKQRSYINDIYDKISFLSQFSPKFPIVWL